MKVLKIIGSVLVLLCAEFIHAQPGEFRLGFDISPGVSWMTTNTRSISKVGSNLTLGMGARGEIGVSDHWTAFAGLGIGFNRGGMIRHETGGNFFPSSRLSSEAYNSGQKPLPNGTRLRYHLKYVEMPVGLKWTSEDRGTLRIYAEAPVVSWGLAIGRRGDIRAGDIHAENEDISRDVSAFNINLGFGAGVEYPVREKLVLVGGVHFHRGILDITGNKATTATPNPNNNPFDPDDDYILLPEKSHATLNMLVLRIGVLF